MDGTHQNTGFAHSMSASVDQLISEIAFLKERVKVLEETAYSAQSDYVEGWTEAAKLLGVSQRTCKRRHEDGQFPKPCGMVEIERADGKTHESPRWRRADLVRYAENLKAA